MVDLFFLIFVVCISLVALAITLAMVTVGIWSQERAGSLAQEPSGLCASLARSLLGLHVRCAGVASPREPGHVRD